MEIQQFIGLVLIIIIFLIIFYNGLKNFGSKGRIGTNPRESRVPIQDIKQKYTEISKNQAGEKEEVVNEEQYIFEIFNSANEFQNKGDHEKAIDLYLKIINRFKSESLTIQNKAIVETSYEIQNDGQWHEIEDFTPLESIYFNLGQSYWKLFEVKKAKEAFAAAIKYQTDPKAIVFARLGDTKLKLEDWSCIEDYTRAIEEDPEYYDAYFNRALAYSHHECEFRNFNLAKKDLEIYLINYPLDEAANKLMSTIAKK